jgi:hypothetical protein
MESKYSFSTSAAPVLQPSVSFQRRIDAEEYAHVFFRLPGPVPGVVVALPFDIELENALICGQCCASETNVHTYLLEAMAMDSLDNISAALSAPCDLV